jgi:putative membrane protein
MMGWYGWDHMTGWGWVAMIVGSVVFVALLVLGAVLLVRSARGVEGPAAGASAERVLAERFARGEIDEEEFRRRLATLADTGARTR